MVYFGDKGGNVVTLPHISKRKHALLVITKDKNKSNKIAPKNKVDLELLQHKLVHRSTISLLAVHQFML